MGVAQCYNLHIWSFSNLLPSILVTARHWEGARNWQWAHTVPDEHYSLDSPCTTGRNSGGVWEQILPRLEQLQLVSPVPPPHTTSPSHHGASLAASMCWQPSGKEGDGEASCPPWGHPSCHGEQPQIHVDSAGTAPAENIYGESDAGNGKCCACL